MSSIKLESNASGTGIFTIASPNSNTNRTLTLPDATGTIITTAGGAAISGTTGSFSGDLSFNSGYGSAAVAYGCRAWVNFNGTGTVAIRASGNVTSITDNNTGDYTVNFTTAMPDVNGAATMEASFGTPFGDQVDNKECYVASSSTIQIGTYNAGAYSDAAYIYVALFR